MPKNTPTESKCCKECYYQVGYSMDEIRRVYCKNPDCPCHFVVARKEEAVLPDIKKEDLLFLGCTDYPNGHGIEERKICKDCIKCDADFKEAEKNGEIDMLLARPEPHIEDWEERFDSYISKFLTTDTSKTVVKDFVRHIREEAYQKGREDETDNCSDHIGIDTIRTNTLDRVVAIINEIKNEAEKGEMKIVDIFTALLTKITSMREGKDHE